MRKELGRHLPPFTEVSDARTHTSERVQDCAKLFHVTELGKWAMYIAHVCCVAMPHKHAPINFDASVVAKYTLTTVRRRRKLKRNAVTHAGVAPAFEDSADLMAPKRVVNNRMHTHTVEQNR